MLADLVSYFIDLSHGSWNLRELLRTYVSFWLGAIHSGVALHFEFLLNPSLLVVPLGLEFLVLFVLLLDVFQLFVSLEKFLHELIVHLFVEGLGFV